MLFRSEISRKRTAGAQVPRRTIEASLLLLCHVSVAREFNKAVQLPGSSNRRHFGPLAS